MYWVVLVLQCPALPNYRKKEKGDLSPTVYASLSVYNQFIYHGLSSPHASQQQQPAQLHAQQQTQSISTLLSTLVSTTLSTHHITSHHITYGLRIITFILHSHSPTTKELSINYVQLNNNYSLGSLLTRFCATILVVLGEFTQIRGKHENTHFIGLFCSHIAQYDVIW